MSIHGEEYIFPGHGTPQSDPISAAYAANVDSGAQEAEGVDEWEYEYSTTETETFYVTLDLTTPDISSKVQSKPLDPTKRHMRWTNPAVGRRKRQDVQAPVTFTVGPKHSVDKQEVKGADDDVENEDDIDGQENEDKEDAPDARSSQSAQVQTTTADIPTPADERPARNQVQILDLHTSNPIVSYDGVVYSCQWAANIGTELIFTPHDPASNLPVLRNLPGDVDLLAASSARLISRVLELKRKEAPSETKISAAAEGPRKRRSSDNDVEIPIGPNAREKRKEQGRFLENLMKIKARKGESDLVTVNTTRRMTANKIKADFKTMRESEKRKLRNQIKKDGDEGVIGSAKQRLEYIERDEEAMRRWEEKVEQNLVPFRSGRKKKVRISEGGLEIRPGIFNADGNDGPGARSLAVDGIGGKGPGRPRKARVEGIGFGEVAEGRKLEVHDLGVDGAGDANTPDYEAMTPKSYDNEEMQEVEGEDDGYGYRNESGRESGTEEEEYDADPYADHTPI